MSRCSKLVRLYQSTQVKLHGAYSPKRVQELAKFTHETSSVRSVSLAVLTPVLSLIPTLLVDIIPLSDPSAGVNSNKMFYVRLYCVTLTSALLCFQQFRLGVPILPYPANRVIRDAVLVSAGSCGIEYGLALVIGFPTPFTIQHIVPPWTMLISLCLFTQWRSLVPETPGATKMLVDMLKIWCCDVLVAAVYIPYFVTFKTLSRQAQMWFILLLPALKLLMRNLFARAVHHLGDETPEIVVFNADVFGSLFVSCCMQLSPSFQTTLAIMTADILLMGLSIRDLGVAHSKLSAVERLLDRECLCGSHHSALGHIKSRNRMPTTLERANILLSRKDFASRNLTLVTTQQLDQALDQTRNQVEDPRLPDLPALIVLKQLFCRNRVGPIFYEGDTILLRQPTALTARSYTTNVRRLLYMAEFLLLVNYVEVIIPLVYSFYLVTTYHMPNQAYYSVFYGMDRTQLYRTLKNVLLYGLLQLASLLLLMYKLKFTLGLSPLHQLGFVLEKQFQWVQVHLMFWIMYNVQGTLEHYGNDYTFKFTWLFN